MNAWEFAEAIWRGQGVERACLELQDRHGQCVPLMLWRLWADAQRRPVSEAMVVFAVEAARLREAEIIAPLRAKRSWSQVLNAERELLDLLERHTPGPADAPCEPLKALSALTKAWGAPAPAEALEVLAAATRT